MIELSTLNPLAVHFKGQSPDAVDQFVFDKMPIPLSTFSSQSTVVSFGAHLVRKVGHLLSLAACAGVHSIESRVV